MRIDEQKNTTKRTWATAGGVAYAVQQGVSAVRVYNVQDMRDNFSYQAWYWQRAGDWLMAGPPHREYRIFG